MAPSWGHSAPRADQTDRGCAAQLDFKRALAGWLAGALLALLLWLPLHAQEDGVYVVAPGDTLGVIDTSL